MPISVFYEAMKQQDNAGCFTGPEQSSTIAKGGQPSGFARSIYLPARGDLEPEMRACQLWWGRAPGRGGPAAAQMPLLPARTTHGHHRGHVHAALVQVNYARDD